jgi:ribosome-associated toxin RatA of RatAB toxin-antitoxin module
MQLKRNASSAVSCEPGLVYEIVSDYGAYQQWLPGIASSKVLAQEINFAIVELEFVAKPGVKVTVECVHAPTQMVVARSLIGNHPELKLEWKIRPAESGQAQVTLAITAPLNFGFLFGGYSGFFNPKKGLAGLMGTLAAFGGGPSGGEKVIEISETEEGLICWYRGTKYQMKEMS